MGIISFILIGSSLMFPAVALWALWWAGRNGELSHLDRAALLPFDEQEPVGRMTDVVLNRPRSGSAAPGDPVAP
ncbi:MAG: cbb3-type cytochrome oxidase assembly protein CcoS [Verrucomicrobiae bacterium]|nr:cbb3-type cytochrome oxidase assembly protein CcoS [Verrucomicrobiae bacterium]